MNVRENPQHISAAKPRYGIDPYLDWLAGEGIPVTEDYGVYLFDVETAPWPRYGVNAAAVHLKGRGDFANMFVFDIAGGKSTAPQRHLYEEVIYVLEGHGSTQLEFADGSRRSFEWGEKSLFAIPLNAKHRHFNGSGTRARASGEHHQPADGDECLPQRSLRVRQRVRFLRTLRQE